MKIKFKKSAFNLSILPKLLQHIQTLDDDKFYEISVEKVKKCRSLNANAYFWTLCGKLAAKVGLPPKEIYRVLVKDVGDNYFVQPLRNDAIEKFEKIWSVKGDGWICDNLGSCHREGYSNVIAYYGSSEYDSKQMARLIDLIVTECKNNDIETATPEEIARMTEEWGNGKK